MIRKLLRNDARFEKKEELHINRFKAGGFAATGIEIWHHRGGSADDPSKHLLGRSAPSNTMRLGCIGTGRMGRGDMQNALYRGLDESANARIVAVCDLDINRAQSAKKLVESKYLEEFGKGKFDVVNAYGDFRELLARDDIDGVTISTPDHWHAPMGVLAARAGKHVCIEKPLTTCIAHGR
ncbi:MAG TPA: Gfo/Idh/MocA family oxidoreductase, partial [Verrucomicrobiales bacterium]|nr:Gfo/Idh/MocA family oxidoreductase [Verrucomicrobiales bacterium]